MAIINIDRDYGVSPSIIRLETTDSYNTITANGYLTAQAHNIFIVNGGAFTFLPSDLVCCYYAVGHAFFNLSTDFSTLVELGSSSLTIVGTANEINVTTSGNISTVSFATNVIFPNDITVNTITVGQGNFVDGSNLALGYNALSGNTSGSGNTVIGNGSAIGLLTGNDNTIIGYAAGLSLTSASQSLLLGTSAGNSISSGQNNVCLGFDAMENNNGDDNIMVGTYAGVNVGLTSNGSQNTYLGISTGIVNTTSGVTMLGGNGNIFIGYNATANNATASGTIAIGTQTTSLVATGITSGTFGPGISFGSSIAPVGFRGDGTAIPAGSQQYWRVVVNSTPYDIPLITDAAALLWPASGTLATTSQLPNQAVNTGSTPTFVSIATTPAVSAASTLILGTAYQNTLGYDVILIVYLDIASATTAAILSGVGSTSTPTQQTIIASVTTATDVFIPVTVYLPNGYYALISTTGTISVTISGQQSTPV